MEISTEMPLFCSFHTHTWVSVCAPRSLPNEKRKQLKNRAAIFVRFVVAGALIAEKCFGMRRQQCMANKERICTPEEDKVILNQETYKKTKNKCYAI